MPRRKKVETPEIENIEELVGVEDSPATSDKVVPIPEEPEVEGSAVIPEAQEKVVPESNRFHRYVAIKRKIRHPYAGVFIETTHPSIPLEEDGWLVSQEQAGLIRKD